MTNTPVGRSQFVRLWLTAITLLFLGVAYYWLVRTGGSTFFLYPLPRPPALADLSFLAPWLDWLPSFLHVFSFSILTWLTLDGRHPFACCALWFLVNAFFEVGQLLPEDLAQCLPNFANLRGYCTKGVFDPVDVVACLAGALIAWKVMSSQEISGDRRVRGIGQPKAVPAVSTRLGAKSR